MSRAFLLLPYQISLSATLSEIVVKVILTVMKQLKKVQRRYKEGTKKVQRRYKASMEYQNLFWAFFATDLVAS